VWPLFAKKSRKVPTRQYALKAEEVLAPFRDKAAMLNALATFIGQRWN
jgi:hypothetical protein